MGVTDVEFIIAEGIAIGPEQRQSALAGALAAAGNVTPFRTAA
jgi:FMN-dependent NADH-azoreductase